MSASKSRTMSPNSGNHASDEVDEAMMKAMSESNIGAEGSDDDDGDNDEDGSGDESETKTPSKSSAATATQAQGQASARTPEQAQPDKPRATGSKLGALKNKFASKATDSQSGGGDGQVQAGAPVAGVVHAGVPFRAGSSAPAQQPSGGSAGTSRGVFISGRNIGSGAKEPEWTPEQLAAIVRASETVLPASVALDTRRSVEDPERKYVRKDENGGVAATSDAMLGELDLDVIKVAFGAPRLDEKVGKKFYCDIVCMSRKNDWVLNQWTVLDVIMEPVDEKILNRQARLISGRPERKIGQHFARFGLPKANIGPIFATVLKSAPGVLDNVSSTAGYYWVNASWGVNTNPGTFIYMDENGNQHSTSDLTSAMRMLGTQSSMGVATIAISVSCDAIMTDGKPTPTMKDYTFSIKCHNFFHLDKVDYHGPPQSASTGMQMSNKLMARARPLSKPDIATKILSTTGDVFGTTAINPFASRLPSQNTADAGPSNTSMYLS